MVAKIIKSTRLEPELAERLTVYAETVGVNESTAIAEAISAGLDALQQARNNAQGAEATDETLESLQSQIHTLELQLADKDKEASEKAQAEAEHIADLRDAIATLKEQLTIKDSQITNLQTLTDQAQKLHAMTETKALEAAESKEDRRGWWARHFG